MNLFRAPWSVVLTLSLVPCLAHVPPAAAQAPMGSAFTYQGRLSDGGAPGNATYDLQFQLYDLPSAGTQVGPTLSRIGVTVTKGLFTVKLDFGAAAFDGSARWLQVAVRPGGTMDAFLPLTPRQELTPSPAALFSAAVPWTGITGKPAGFADDADNDTLAGLGCSVGQVAKSNGQGWTCANDIDTNSGGTVTGVVAGSGLAGGGGAGTVSLSVGGGPGIIVSVDSISLDVTFTDQRYVNATGDTMSGSLNMNGQRLYNRGCPTGFLTGGPALCVEATDANGYTFTGCANRCLAEGAHICTSQEVRGMMAAGVHPGAGFGQDWLGEQAGDDNALYVNNVASAENPDGTRPTSTTVNGYCRCCESLE